MEALSASLQVQVGSSAEGSYAIEPANLFVSTAYPYHRYYRLYHGDDVVKVVVSAGEVDKLGQSVELKEDTGFPFSGTNESSIAYKLGASTSVSGLEVVGDAYDLEGDPIRGLTFTLDKGRGVLVASEPFYGLVKGTINIPYTLLGYRYKVTTEILHSIVSIGSIAGIINTINAIINII